MDNSRLTQPWFQHSALYSSPHSLILKLALGELPEYIPAYADTRIGARDYAQNVDGGAVDRVLSIYTGARRVARLHPAASSLRSFGNRHVGYNDLEQHLGLARTLRVEVDETCNIGYLLNALRPLAAVEEAYPHYLCTLPFTDTVPVQQLDPEAAWAARAQIRAAEAAAYQPGDPAVIAAVVDTGVALEHRELQGMLRQGFDSVNLSERELPAGIQLVGDAGGIDRIPADSVGHGTSCLAIIGGCGKQIPPGMAYGCSLLPVRALGSAMFPGRRDPVGIGGAADIDYGLKIAVDLGAKVINCSFGSPIGDLEPGESAPHFDVVKYALARGCILVAASGNSGRQQPYSPCALDGVIAVGAVDSSGKPTRFSTSGYHVALCAPGERVLSAGLDGYSLVTGTSFAAPFVAATCALMAARALSRAYPLDSATARRVLVESAGPFPTGVEGHHGAGILDALAALEALDRYIDEQEDAESAVEVTSRTSRMGRA